MTRAERRNNWEKARRAAVRLWLKWHRNRDGDLRFIKARSYSDGIETVQLYTASEIAKEISQIAGVHGSTCGCWMCRYKDPNSLKAIKARGFADELETE